MAMHPAQLAQNLDAILQQESKNLSCVFYRKDPMRYPECHNLTHTRIKDLKAHLLKQHRLPLYCPVCGRVDFADAESRDAHIVVSQCVEQPEGSLIEGLDQAQVALLEKRADRRIGLQQQYLKIWAIVFPNEPLPFSPFMASYVTEVVRMLLDHWHVHGPALAGVDHAVFSTILQSLCYSFLLRDAARGMVLDPDPNPNPTPPLDPALLDPNLPNLLDPNLPNLMFADPNYFPDQLLTLEEVEQLMEYNNGA